MNTADDIKKILDNEDLLKEKTKKIFKEKDIDGFVKSHKYLTICN